MPSAACATCAASAAGPCSMLAWPGWSAAVAPSAATAASAPSAGGEAGAAAAAVGADSSLGLGPGMGLEPGPKSFAEMPAGSVATKRTSGGDAALAGAAPGPAAVAAGPASFAAAACGELRRCCARSRSRSRSLPRAGGVVLRRTRRPSVPPLPPPSLCCRGSSLMRGRGLPTRRGLLPALRGGTPRRSSRSGLPCRLRLPLLRLSRVRSRLALRARRRGGLALRGRRGHACSRPGPPVVSGLARMPSKPGGPLNSLGRPGSHSRSPGRPPAKPPADGQVGGVTRERWGVAEVSFGHQQTSRPPWKHAKHC